MRQKVGNGLYTTTGDDQFSWRTERKRQSTSQNQTCTQKRSWSLLDALLLVRSTTTFWISAQPVHLRSMLSTSTGRTEHCEACSWHGQQKRPVLLRVGAWPHVAQAMLASSASSAIFTWPLAEWVALQVPRQHFCTENTSMPSRIREGSPSLLDPEVCWVLCYRNKLISCRQKCNCWLQWFLFWLIKMCLSLLIRI